MGLWCTIVGAAHEALRELFRRFDVLSHLRALTRDLGRGFGAEIGEARDEARQWLAGDGIRTADIRFVRIKAAVNQMNQGVANTTGWFLKPIVGADN